MDLIFKISVRNLFRHIGKSLVIGVIILIGSCMMTLGNSVITGMEKGIEENFVDSFIGDLVVVSQENDDDNIVTGPMKQITEIDNHQLVKEFVESQPFVDRTTSIALGRAVSLDPDGDMGMIYLMGVDMDSYQAMFDTNIILIEGELLEGNEIGLMINSDNREMIYNQNDYWLIPQNSEIVETNLTPDAQSNLEYLRTRDELILMGFGDDNSAKDIRVPVKSVMKFKTLNYMLRQINLVDIESFRQTFGMVSAAQTTVELSEEEQAVMDAGADDLESMFSDFSFEIVESGSSIGEPEIIKETVSEPDEDLNLEAGAYHVIQVRVVPGYDGREAVEELNEAFNEEGLNVRAVYWKEASGQIGQLSDLARVSLFVFVSMIFLVAIIVIINTLSMSAMERTTEIGMMRAVGAQKKFIGRMFFLETTTLAFSFGTLGIFFGWVISGIIRAMNIAAENDLLGLIFGGDTFQPFLSGMNIVQCFIYLALVTLLAMIYPIRLARRITPLEAISRD